MKAHLDVLRQVWRAPGNRGKRLRALIRAARWYANCHRREPPPARVDLPVFGDRVFPCHPDSIIAKHVMYRSEWFDYDLMHFMDGYLAPGDTCVDVGANVGLHMLMASRRIVHGAIHCVEPNAANLARLRECIDMNHVTCARVLPVAAGDRNGRAALVGGDVFGRIEAGAAPQPGEAEVEVRRLDELLPPGMVHLCKLDIEGAEWLALKGLSRFMIEGWLPVLVIELCGHLAAFGGRERDFLKWLQTQGYQPCLYRHDERRFDCEGPFAGDVFAVTPTGRELIASRMPEARW